MHCLLPKLKVPYDPKSNSCNGWRWCRWRHSLRTTSFHMRQLRTRSTLEERLEQSASSAAHQNRPHKNPFLLLKSDNLSYKRFNCIRPTNSHAYLRFVNLIVGEVLFAHIYVDDRHVNIHELIGDSVHFSCGGTPSGHFHWGTMREMVVVYSVHYIASW